MNNIPRGIPTVWEDGRGSYDFTRLWTYTSADNLILGHVARYGDGTSKCVLPFFRQDEFGNWHAGAPAEPRPLYGIRSLTRDLRTDEPRPYPAAALFIPEGEKCTQALHDLGLSAVTWPGGSKAVEKADWQSLFRYPLQRILLLPDDDEPGIAAMQTVARILEAHPDKPTIETLHGGIYGRMA